jgi:hypothetical protein
LALAHVAINVFIDHSNSAAGTNLNFPKISAL